jgi:GNAT superfamily N-acetyltransferase
VSASVGQRQNNRRREQVTFPDDPLHLERLSILDTPDRHDVQFLDDRLYEYNVSRTGIADGRLLAIILRDRHNDIIAGLYGWTWGRCCEVKTLWVHEQWRGQGLGTRLMTAAEDEARTRGAAQIVLSTHSFQAPDFYRRLGFESVGHIEDYPVGYQNVFLRKRLQ